MNTGRVARLVESQTFSHMHFTSAQCCTSEAACNTAPVVLAPACTCVANQVPARHIFKSRAGAEHPPHTRSALLAAS